MQVEVAIIGACETKSLSIVLGHAIAGALRARRRGRGGTLTGPCPVLDLEVEWVRPDLGQSLQPFQVPLPANRSRVKDVGQAV